MAEKSSSELHSPPDKFIVVLAVDQSEYSERAFKWYLKNLYTASHVVHIIHVLGTPKSPAKRRESWDHSKKVGDNYLSWAEQNGVKDARFESPNGEHEWQEILKYAEKVGAQMITVGCRALGSPRKTLTGSVADSVLKHSSIPILVCRAKSD